MKRIILFRFHDNFDVCKNRIELIRYFNPKTKIYGLYGGLHKNFSKAKKLPLDHVYELKLDDSHWKWKNGDLCVREWYKNYGKKLKFDMLHIIEWDLILLDSVQNYFKKIKEGVVLTQLEFTSKLAKGGWCWIIGNLPRWDFNRLKQTARKNFNWKGRALGGVFPGASMSKKFLEKFSKLEDVQSRCNDEVRLPLYAQCFNMKVQNTGFKIGEFFNCEKDYFDAQTIYKNVKKGVKVFHPVKEKLDIKKIT